MFYETGNQKARLDLYLEIPADKILFRKNNKTGKYESSFSFAVTVSNANNEKIINELYVNSPSYKEDEMKIVSNQPKYFLYNYYFEPGNYKLTVKIKDNISGSEYSGSSAVSAKDLQSSGITFSGLMLLSKFKISDNDTKEITPLVSKNIFGLKEFYIFFEIFSGNNDTITKEYEYKIKDEKDELIKEGQFVYLLNPGNNRKTEIISVSKELKKFLPDERDFEFFPSDNLPPDKFKIEITDKSSNEIVAGKEFLYRPGRIQREMYERQRMH